jgi:signal transduction histidine kinase
VFRSIRARITAIATFVVVLVLVLTGIALIGMQRRTLTDNLDETLVKSTEAIAASNRTPVTSLGDEDAITQIVGSSGNVIGASANATGLGPVYTLATDRDEALATIRVPHDDVPYRVHARRHGDEVILAAFTLDDVDESVRVLRVGLFFAIPAVAFVLGLLVWWLVGRTLRPVEAMRTEVADITAQHLDRRVPQPRTDDEIARLAETMNAMLDRLEVAADRQRRFVADASHELRSPLARMRSELEVDLEHPETADARATQESLLEETRHLQRLVDDLLSLARNDGTPLRREPVDLDDLVLRESARVRAEHALAVDSTGVRAAQVAGDPEQLTRLLRNLTDNAARHARTRIALAVHETDGTAECSVADDGPGIPSEMQTKIFERFARSDEARARADGGAGLGLSIARDIAERHGGTLEVDPDYGPGARFVLRLPRRTPDSP